MTNTARLILFFLLCFLITTSAIADQAPERSTPYTAVKWEGDDMYVLIGTEWYLFVSIDGIASKDIAAASKEKYRKYWRKRMSLDLTEILVDMGHPLPATVKLSLKNGKKSVELSEEMTTKNKNLVWKYLKEHPVPEDPDPPKKSTAKYNTDSLQSKIAKAVNLTMDKPFSVKSAKVQYTIEGSKLFAGTETVYFDDFGKTVVVITDIPNKPMSPEKTTVIWKDNKTTFIDHLKKTYYTTPVRTKSTEPAVISYSTPTQRKQGGYETQSSQKIAGKECEVFKHSKMNVSYYLWKGVSLKEINYALGGEMGFTKTATTVEDIASIPASTFEIPAGYKKK